METAQIPIHLWLDKQKVVHPYIPPAPAPTTKPTLPIFPTPAQVSTLRGFSQEYGHLHCLSKLCASSTPWKRTALASPHAWGRTRSCAVLQRKDLGTGLCRLWKQEWGHLDRKFWDPGFSKIGLEKYSPCEEGLGQRKTRVGYSKLWGPGQTLATFGCLGLLVILDLDSHGLLLPESDN